MRKIMIRRRKSFPYGARNYGSVFKCPAQGKPVGQMVDELGLKGIRIGGAVIPNVHSGFIINDDDATGRDIISLAGHMANEIEAAYGRRLEMEQCLV